MLDANSDNIVFASPNEFGQNEQITFQGFNLKGNSNESKFGVKLGDQTMTLKQFKLTIDGKDTVALDGFNLVSKFGEQGSSNIGGQIDYTMDALKVQGQRLRRRQAGAENRQRRRQSAERLRRQLQPPDHGAAATGREPGSGRV